MNRQYVHLSADQATAQKVGARHAPTPVILEIRAAEAHQAGVRFIPATRTYGWRILFRRNLFLTRVRKME